MNELSNVLTNVFQYESNDLRMVLKDGEPWFVAKDVCEVLEIANPSDAIKRLDEDERSRFNLGRQGEVNIVNEPGLYALILGSKKPEAKQFKRWVTHEVLPVIRKTGQYVKPLSEREQLVAAMKLSIEVSEEVTAIKTEMVSMKNEVKEIRSIQENQITLESGEQRRVQIAIAQRVYELENEKDLRPGKFAELHREIRNRFGVATYKDIRKKDLQATLAYIEAWVPRRVS